MRRQVTVADRLVHDQQTHHKQHTARLVLGVILIPTYYVGSNMGRQHTTWISDETWDRLKNITGDSVSKKISNAVKFADPDQMMIQNAKMRQLTSAKSVLREIALRVQEGSASSHSSLEGLLAEFDWLWESDIRES